MHTTAVPDASAYLSYNPNFLSTDSPGGLWLCTSAEDAAVIGVNAAALPLRWQDGDILGAKPFLESFSHVLVVGADPDSRAALAHALGRLCPSVEICVTSQSAYHGCDSVAKLRDVRGMCAVEDLWQDAEELPPHGLVEISGVEQVDISSQSHAKSGIPPLDKLIGGLYDGEVSVWTGKRKEGKSTLLGLPILSAIREGRRVCVYSGELPDWRYKAWLLAMAAGPANLVESKTDTGKTVWTPKADISRQIELWWKGRLFLLDNRVGGIHQPEKLLDLMRYAHKRYGVSCFVVDNLMTVELPGEDYYRAQSKFVGALIDFSHETKTHVHLVAHRRKGGTGKGAKGDSDDVSGSGDITNRADNTFAVSRSADDDSPFDATVEILANRDFGASGIIPLRFDARSRRYYVTSPNWSCGWETAPLQSSLFSSGAAESAFQEIYENDPNDPFLEEPS